MKLRILRTVLTVALSVAAGVAALYFLQQRRAALEAERNAAIEAALPPPTPKPEPPKSAWNTYHGDNALRGVAQGALPDTLAIRWRFKTAAPVRETPVSDGERIFFATCEGQIFATDFTGQQMWTRELPTGAVQNGVAERERIDAPLAYFDGMLLVGTMRGALYALDADSGGEKWHAQIEGSIMGTPNYLPPKAGEQSGRVYLIGRGDGVLYCLDAGSGAILWHSEPIARCDGSPSVSPDAVAFGSCDAALHVFSPDTGKILWNIAIDEDSQIAGGVAIDGASMFSGCRSGKILHADAKTGQIVWVNKDNDAEAFATPAITAAWVVACSSDGNVMGLDRATGALRWKFDTKGDPYSPVIVADRVVVAADGTLFLLRLADGVVLWSQKVGDEITAPAVVRDTILVGNEDGSVVAVAAPAESKEPSQP